MTAFAPSSLSSSFAPRGLLRNPHLQGIASRLPNRRARIEAAARVLHDNGRSLLLHAGDAQLLGWLSQHPVQDQPPVAKRPLVVLIHGWEGSSDSLYLLATATEVFNAGFDVLRLNLRDHGDSHHLNAELFHSCRDEEVALAVLDAVHRLQPPSLALAGFSLGGNFAMRVSLRLREAPLKQVVAVCPVISPPATLRALETGPLLYRAYFLRKWKESLQRKAAVHPEQFRDDRWRRLPNLTALTAHFVEQHTEYPSLLDYLNGYAMTEAKLAALPAPTHVIVAADDPVIPVADWQAIRKPAQLTLEITRHGGHCGFVTDWSLTGWSERRVSELLQRALADSAV